MVETVKDDLRRILLAAAGAVGLASDEAKKVMGRLVARGEVAEKDAKVVLEKIASSKPVTATTAAVTGAAKKAGKVAERGWDAVLSKLNMPSRSDIEALEHKIDRLNTKLRRLAKDKE
ncbi:MAG: phasin family protein [Planctomycetes bacterium]|nr:phasin family protein [Planctomycetota bacterium]